MTYCDYSLTVMHNLFSLQVDIDALNHKSSYILYSWGSAVGEFPIPKTCLIGFPSFNLRYVLSSLSFCSLIFRVFRFGLRLGQHLRCSLPVTSIIRVPSTMSRAGIRTPTQMLLSTGHHASAHPPSGSVHLLFNVHVTFLPSIELPSLAPEDSLICSWPGRHPGALYIYKFPFHYGEYKFRMGINAGRQVGMGVK
jgi:hypothetical protein